jgi:hypothetical protein
MGVAKVEWHHAEFCPWVGFIVTNLAKPAERVVTFYNQRGTAEQHIKEGKNVGTSCKSRRLRPRQLHAHSGTARDGRAAVARRVVIVHHHPDLERCLGNLGQGSESVLAGKCRVMPVGKTGRGERRCKMFSVKRAVGTIAVLLVMFVPVTATAGTVEKVTVTESGYTRENAIKNAAQAAVQTIVERYMASGTVGKNRRMIIDQILDRSNDYLDKINIVDERMHEDGIVEVTAEAVVEVDKIMTTLRNLDIALKGPEISETFVWRVR